MEYGKWELKNKPPGSYCSKIAPIHLFAVEATFLAAFYLGPILTFYCLVLGNINNKYKFKRISRFDYNTRLKRIVQLPRPAKHYFRQGVANWRYKSHSEVSS